MPQQAPAKDLAWGVVDKPKADANAKRPAPPVTDTIRSHAEWFAWAKRQRADIGRAHNAARAAVKASEEGVSAEDVEKAARRGMASAEVIPVDETRQAYSAWFAVAAVDMGLDPHKAHAFAEAGYQAQKQNPDLKAATAAAEVAVAELAAGPPPPMAPPPPPPPPPAMPPLPDFTPFTTVPMAHPEPAPSGSPGDWSPPPPSATPSTTARDWASPPPPQSATPPATAGDWAPPPPAEVGDWGPPPGAPQAPPPPLPPPPHAPPPPAPPQATVETDSWLAPTTPPPPAPAAAEPPAATAPAPPPAPAAPAKDAGAWRPPDWSEQPPPAAHTPEPPASPPPEAAPEPPAEAAPAPAGRPAAGRQSAIDKTIADTKIMAVTRSQAKLATYGDVRRLAGRTLLQDALPSEVQLWVVAVAGTLTALAEPAVGHAVAYLALDQHTGVAYDVATGASWPAWFDQLPDLAPE